MTSEITEEKDEDVPCIIDTEAQKKKIRQIIEYQKSLYLSTSSSSSFSSAAASCSSFYSSHKSSSLLEMMKEGSTSLRRLIDMEHTSLGTHMKDYSGSPIIKPILLWGSDTDEIHDDPWSSVKRIGQAALADSGTGRLTSEGSHGDYSAYQKGETIVSKHKLSRTKSFRKLPRFSLRRCKGFRFRLKLRRLRILICVKLPEEVNVVKTFLCTSRDARESVLK
ncbi:hypothetical protein F0562_020079 [Nyssa sinensis]|uniref:Uncharacterized protein n=1 Tax=Nyssa sinensis TaxID=561372 RepID=A0A5J5BQN0_9ASTE|nr:hypothetical protein F0562_020079 [Nyssa sinensis]